MPTVKDDPNIETATLPEFSGGTKADAMYAVGTGITAKSKDKEAAWKFLRFMAMPEGALIC